MVSMLRLNSKMADAANETGKIPSPTNPLKITVDKRSIYEGIINRV